MARPPRAAGITTTLAFEAALAAICACKEKGNKVNALVTDSVGVSVALLSGEGAAAITAASAHVMRGLARSFGPITLTWLSAPRP
jgi:uncharacterized protein GlcG (DUF336 family)